MHGEHGQARERLRRVGVAREQNAEIVESLQARFEFGAKMPNTPARFVDGAIKGGGETKRLMLDRANYYASNGG